MSLYQELELRREQEAKEKEAVKLAYDQEVLSYFKPVSKLTAGRLLKFLSVKTYLNGDKSKIYSRYELMIKCIDENQSNTLMDTLIIKNNLKGIFQIVEVD